MKQPSFYFRKTKHPIYHKTIKYKIIQGFLLITPILISLFLLYQSPNLLYEIKYQNKKKQTNQQIHSIQKILSELKQEKPPTQNPSFFLYFPKIVENKVHLSSQKLPPPQPSQDPIPYILNHLFHKPDKNPIPKETKLLSYQLKQGTLTLNLNDAFLNNKYGEVGKKLKIAQILATITTLPNIHKVTFQINGKNVNFLDRDGLIKNQIFKNSDFEWPIPLE